MCLIYVYSIWIDGTNLLIDLFKQSLLGILTQIEFVAELVYYYFWVFVWEDLYVLHDFVVQFNLQDAYGLRLGCFLWVVKWLLVVRWWRWLGLDGWVGLEATDFGVVVCACAGEASLFLALFDEGASEFEICRLVFGCWGVILGLLAETWSSWLCSWLLRKHDAARLCQVCTSVWISLPYIRFWLEGQMLSLTFVFNIMWVSIVSQLVPLDELLASIMDAGSASISDHPARLWVDLRLVRIFCIFTLVLHALMLCKPLLL